MAVDDGAALLANGRVVRVDIVRWLDGRDGVAHKGDADDAGFRQPAIRHAVASGAVRLIRRLWLVTAVAPADLVSAATSGARLTCVSLARRRGWWIPPDVEVGLHLAVGPHGRAPTTSDMAHVAHWSKPLAPAPARGLLTATEDALQHIATCLPFEQALILWESAVKREKLSIDALRLIKWTTLAARRCAETVRGLSDSGLETLLVRRLSHWRIPMWQQVVIAGRPVDLLIAQRLVIQVDGYAYHSSSADRSRDVAHDAELRLRGYTVLRFTYAQVLYDWPAVERIIARAIAARLHLAA